MAAIFSLLLSVLPAQPVIEPAPIALVPLRAPIAAADDFPEFEYTYVEASYVWADSDALDDELHGWDLTGSFELPLNFFVQATVRQQSADVDFDSYEIGAGWHIGLVGRLDGYAILSYQDVEASGGGVDASTNGPAGELGLRFSLTRSIELNGRLLWSDLEDSESGGGLGARYYFTDMISAGVNADHFADDDLVTAGLRLEL